MLTTMLRLRSIDSPTTSWPSQAAPSLETDEELRDRLGVAPLAKMAFATVSLPATSYDLRAATALQQRDCDAAVADLRVSIGGQSGTVVDPKVVFSKALMVRAAALVLVHNHPSGNPRPSEADKRLTTSLVEVGKALDLPVLDHVIIAGMRHFSFADHQLL